MFIYIKGGGFTSRRGTFGSSGKLETMMSVSYGRIEDLVFSGAATGDIFIWKDTLLLKTVKAHDGPVFAMHALDKVFGSFEINSSLLFLFLSLYQYYHCILGKQDFRYAKVLFSRADYSGHR